MVTIYGTCKVISHEKLSVVLHLYFPKYSLFAVPSMAVFYSPLILIFLVTLLRCFLNDIQMFPVVPDFTGLTFVFTLRMRCISTIRILHLRIFSVSCLMSFLSPEIAMYFNRHAPF